MKKYIRNFLLAFLCLNVFNINIFKVYAVVESREKDYLSNNRQIIRDLNHDIAAEDYCEDIRKLFFEYFFHINKSSMRMNENILKYTKNKSLSKQSRVSIKKSMNNEIKMAAIIESINNDLSNDKEKSDSFNEKFKEVYNDMIDKLKNQQFTGRVDLDFKDTINIHHKYSIELCNEALKYIDGKVETEIINTVIKDYQNDLKKYNEIIT